MAEILRLENVHKSFGDLRVLHDLSMSVNQGEVVSIIGPSGAGKSTILRCINYLEPINSGRIYFEGVPFEPTKDNVYSYRQNFGFVFQSFNLFPHLNVLQNVALAPQKVKKQAKEEARSQAKLLLDSVGLSDKIDSYPRQLSGGQQQRVAIARALAMNPKVMLLDEITSALDPKLTGEVLKVVSDLAKKGMTMIVVTHEIGFAKQVSDRVLFFEGGCIVEDAPPQKLFNNPEEERTKQFLASIIH